MPSIYLLQAVFSADPDQSSSDVVVHMQDYNELVLRLVTFPNIILAWCEYLVRVYFSSKPSRRPE